MIGLSRGELNIFGINEELLVIFKEGKISSQDILSISYILKISIPISA